VVGIAHAKAVDLPPSFSLNVRGGLDPRRGKSELSPGEHTSPNTRSRVSGGGEVANPLEKEEKEKASSVENRLRRSRR
jgi:hypothetical protein